MPEKSTNIDKIIYEAVSGVVSFELQPITVYEDGDVRRHPVHRITVAPGNSVDGPLDAIPAQYARVEAKDAAAIRAFVNAVHTEEVVTGYRARMDAADALEAGGKLVENPGRSNK